MKILVLFSAFLIFNSQIYPQRPEPSPVNPETSTEQEKKDPELRVIGPGSGAYTKDPTEILRDAALAVRQSQSITYAASYFGIGAIATHTFAAKGNVKISRLPSNNPLKARLAAQGEQNGSGSGSDKVVPFHTTFDGRTIRRLRPGEKEIIIKSLTAANPKERSLGFVTSFFGGGPYQLLLLEYLDESPLEHQIMAPTKEYEGWAAVDGILCDVIYIEKAPDIKGRIPKERWYIGLKDHFPRRIEQLARDNNGRWGAYVLTLSNVRTNVWLPPNTFVAGIPKGYTTKQYAEPRHPDPLKAGEIAPEWRLKDAEGNIRNLSDYRGKLIVLDFWATWCGPCVQAMPQLQEVHKRFGSRGVIVIGINGWEEGNAAEFMRRNGYTYGLLLNGETIGDAYRVDTLPANYLVGIDGTIIHQHIGIDENLFRVIEQYLSEKGM